MIDSTDTELAFDSRDERGTLEQCTGELLEATGDFGSSTLYGTVESSYADVFFPCALLALDEASGTIDADEEIACDFRIEGARVTSLFYTEDTFDPSDDFVGAWVAGFIEIDDAVSNVFLKGSAKGSVSTGNGSVMTGSNMKFIVVFEQEWPFGSV